MSELDVVCIGQATTDYISLVESLPKSDQRIESLESAIGYGGPAATAAVTLARLGKKVGFMGIVGDDTAGLLILKNLEKEEVDITRVIIMNGATSPHSQIIVEEKSRNRTIITTGNIRVEIGEINFDITGLPKFLLLDQAGYKYFHDKQLITELFRGHSIAIDGGNDIPNLELTNVNYYMPTRRKIVDLSDDGLNLAESLAVLVSKGAEQIIFTDGENGSYAFSQGKLVFASGLDLPIKSTLGAGDVFHGAFVDGIIDGLDIEKNLLRSNLCAAMACSAIDGQSGIPTKDRLEEELVKISKLNLDSHA